MAITEGLGLEALKVRKSGGSIDEILATAPPGTKANVIDKIRNENTILNETSDKFNSGQLILD